MNLPDAGDFGRSLEHVVGEGHATNRVAGLQAIGVHAQRDEGSYLARPSSAAEIADLIRLCGERGVLVVPVGGASRPPVASQSKRCLYVDCSRLNHVLHLDETSLFVHVQAGVLAMTLERILAPRGLSLGDYPPQAMLSTIGGLLSVRTPGKSCTRHGFIEDAVLGLSAVLPDGKAVHARVAPRRSTGPELLRALCGSEGTLGIITSAVLRIHRRPEARFFVAHALPDLATALRAVRLLFREEVQPSAWRLYDTAAARAHHGNDVIGEGEALLVCATAGPTDLAACDRNLISSVCGAEGGRLLPVELAEEWWNVRTNKSQSTVPPPDLQVGATPGKQLAVHEAVLKHVAAAGGEAHGYISRFESDGAVWFFSLRGADAATLAAAQQAARQAGGSLLGHAPAQWMKIYSELKRELDPLGIMNPDAPFLRAARGDAV